MNGGHRVRTIIPNTSTSKLHTRFLFLAPDIDDDDELVSRVHHRLEFLHDGAGDIPRQETTLLRVIVFLGQAFLQDALCDLFDVKGSELSSRFHAIGWLKGSGWS